MIRFLGSLNFALFLIGSTLLFAIFGTVVETVYQSHDLASKLVYANPLFLLLCFGFFVNILLSALRRYPFSFSHIPFLMTHLGLLLLITAISIKHLYGVQGTMRLLEGAESNEVTLDGKTSLLVETRETKRQVKPVKVGKDFKASVRIRSFLKEGSIDILGLNKVAIEEATPLKNLHAASFSLDSPPFSLIALNEPMSRSLIKDYYLKNGKVKAVHRITKSPTFQGSVQEGVERGLLSFDPSSFSLSFADKKLSLQDPLAFLIDTYAIDIEIPPALFFIDCDKKGELIAIGSNGLIYTKEFSHTSPSPIYSLDKGFSGYTLELSLPLERLTIKREQLETLFEEELGAFIKTRYAILPPVDALSEKALGSFFATWYLEGGELISERASFKPLLLRELLDPTSFYTPQEMARLLSHYFASMGLFAKHLVSEASFKPKDGLINLESYLSLEMHEAKDDDKDTKSVAYFLYKGKKVLLSYGQDGFTLPFNWEGKELLSLIGSVHLLPFKIKLLKTGAKFHEGTSSPASYFAHILYGHEGNMQPFTLAMNEVLDFLGYRIYLSGIDPIDPAAVKTAHLVVNYDPVKWVLTYPSLLILSLGAALVLLQAFKRSDKTKN